MPKSANARIFRGNDSGNRNGNGGSKPNDRERDRNRNRLERNAPGGRQGTTNGSRSADEDGWRTVRNRNRSNKDDGPASRPDVAAARADSETTANTGSGDQSSAVADKTRDCEKLISQYKSAKDKDPASGHGLDVIIASKQAELDELRRNRYQGMDHDSRVTAISKQIDRKTKEI